MTYIQRQIHITYLPSHILVSFMILLWLMKIENSNKLNRFTRIYKTRTIPFPFIEACD
jgi:hypothetical protein